MPEWGGIIGLVGVEGIDAIMLRGYENHVIGDIAQHEMRYKKRLRIDTSIYRIRHAFAKMRRIYCGRIEIGLLRIRSSARKIIFICKHRKSRRILCVRKNPHGCQEKGGHNRYDQKSAQKGGAAPE